MEFSLDHVAVSVSDLEVSIEFYTKVFGFACERIIDMPNDRGKIALLRKPGCTIEMFRFTGASALEGEKRELLQDLSVLGDRHLAFRVGNIHDTVDYLEKAGVEFMNQPVIGSRGYYRFFVKDPDGIPIELTEGPE